jgi:hypothetical protein
LALALIQRVTAMVNTSQILPVLYQHLPSN